MPEPLRVLLHNDNTQNLARRLHAAFPDVEIHECNSYGDLPAKLENCRPEVVYTVRFAGTSGFPRELLFSDRGPLWIANGGAGTDHFGKWDTSRTTVTNAAGVAADMMAEYVIGCFLHFTLNIQQFQADKAGRQWAARVVTPLKGKTLLIVGLGHTGRAIATRAKAFGMKVIGTRAHPKPMENVEEVKGASGLPELLPRADFIAVSSPLTHKTKGLIGPAEFSAMKRGVVIADVSRGSVVDQTALCSAMQSDTVAAAALDVFETEPLPPESPLWALDNLIISPHCSSVYDGWEDASFDLFLTNLQRWKTNQPLLNVVDPHRGY